jgi:hypothetical protein
MTTGIRKLVRSVGRRPGESSSKDRHDRIRSRLADQRLERTLAEYRAPSERLELGAILGRYPDEDTVDVRRALDRQDLNLDQAQSVHLHVAR